MNNADTNGESSQEDSQEDLSGDWVGINPPEQRFRYFNQMGRLRISDQPKRDLFEAKQDAIERVIVCVDGSNLFYAALQIALAIDYSKLLKELVGDRALVRAYFYTGVDPDNIRQKAFLMWLKRHGFRVMTRDLVSLPNGAKTGNLDVEIAVDMFRLADHCDTIILLSGDGDLAYAVERASQKGVRFEVVSLRSMTSEAMLNVADVYTDLADLAPRIAKTVPKYQATRTPSGQAMADA